MNRYSSYSKSPLEWMGVIPSHWIYTKNRFGFKKWKNGKNESDETLVLSLTIKGIKIKEDLSFGKSTESYIGHQLVEKGDIVFTPRDFDQTPILSDVSKYDGCISNLYIVDKTNERVLNHYINYYWYGLKYSVDYFKNFSYGIRFSFNRFQFDEIPLLIPPLEEQTQIVSFLDTKTKKIDELIEKTEQKIELLKEKRTSLINHCVTKGLNPNVEMKDSGVEWIGEIPSGWDVKKLKYVSDIFSSSVDRHIHEDEIQVSICHYPDVYNNEFINDEIELNKGSCSEVEFQRYILKKGLVILTKDSETPDDIGNPCYVEIDFDNVVCGYHLTIIENNDINVNSKFLFRFIQSDKVRCHFETESRGITRFSLGKSKIENLFVNLPSYSEQTQIVEYLDEQTQKIDSTIEKETQRTELLKEYRQSLISEVVTGKIDVRDYNG
ncbi:MAG: restriction endonuclease subunit S [Candidatus Marinimicrobia bacterium]|jgi:type I restriction enzyme, S subunit|nr:restriction endonuclease subunit S [Candidatus Neomarinimicrobiota bacterium]